MSTQTAKYRIPNDKACSLCGAFVVLKHEKNQFQAPHSGSQCPLRAHPSLLLSVLQNINQRLMYFTLGQIAENQVLQRLVYRKAMIEVALQRMDVHMSLKGPKIAEFSYPVPAESKIQNPANESILSPEESRPNDINQESLSSDENLLNVSSFDYMPGNGVLSQHHHNNMNPRLNQLSMTSPRKKFCKRRRLSEPLAHPLSNSWIPQNRRNTLTDRLGDSSPIYGTMANSASNNPFFSSLDSDSADFNLENHDAEKADDETFFHNLINHGLRNNASSAPVTSLPGSDFSPHFGESKHKNDDSADYHEFQAIDDPKGSDDEYESFVSAVTKDLRPVGEDEDDPFPEEVAKMSREPLEEYRNDPDVMVSEEELKELFAEDTLSNGEGSAIESSPLTRQQNNQNSGIFGLVTKKNIAKFHEQLGKNAQIVLQNMAISRELQLNSESSHFFWRNQLKQLCEVFGNKYADDTNRELILPIISLVPKLASLVDSAPPSIAFNKAVQSRFKKQTKDPIPYPPSLSIVMEHASKWFYPDIYPDIHIGNNKKDFKEIEDALLAIGLAEFGTNYHLIQEEMLPNRDISSLKTRVKNLGARKNGDNLVKKLVFRSRIPLSEREQVTLERVSFSINFLFQTQTLGSCNVWTEFQAHQRQVSS